MTIVERVVLCLGAWVYLSAFVNGLNGEWLGVAVCMAWGCACMVWVFGRGRERRERRIQRQQEKANADLLRQIENKARMAVENNNSGEWIITREGFYVRAEDVNRGREVRRAGGRTVGRSDQKRD